LPQPTGSALNEPVKGRNGRGPNCYQCRSLVQVAPRNAAQSLKLHSLPLLVAFLPIRQTIDAQFLDGDHCARGSRHWIAHSGAMCVVLCRFLI
jgi:hypothetical protein